MQKTSFVFASLLRSKEDCQLQLQLQETLRLSGIGKYRHIYTTPLEQSLVMHQIVSRKQALSSHHHLQQTVSYQPDNSTQPLNGIVACTALYFLLPILCFCTEDRTVIEFYGQGYYSQLTQNRNMQPSVFYLPFQLPSPPSSADSAPSAPLVQCMVHATCINLTES